MRQHTDQRSNTGQVLETRWKLHPRFKDSSRRVSVHQSVTSGGRPLPDSPDAIGFSIFRPSPVFVYIECGGSHFMDILGVLFFEVLKVILNENFFIVKNSFFFFF